MKLSHWFLLFLSLFLSFSTRASAKNRDPKDYPQRARVVSFQREPCLLQVGGLTRVCHVITFEVEGRSLAGSCFRCDPLQPGETYPARLDQKEMVIYVIHRKDDGSWGQDNYAITNISQPEPR